MEKLSAVRFLSLASFLKVILRGSRGGNMLHGFMMGAVSKAGGSALDAGTDRMGWTGKMAANSIFAGTVDELGGDKFANGAITGAFTYLFNEKLHRVQDRGDSDDDGGNYILRSATNRLLGRYEKKKCGRNGIFKGLDDHNPKIYP